MAKKIDFGRIVRSAKKKASNAKKALNGLAENPPEAKLEKELQEFHGKPKQEREQESKGFDFSQITNQIKQKIEAAPVFGAEGAGENNAENIIGLEDSLAQKSEKHSALSKLKRVSTGIKGMDELIEGGFEKGSSVLLVGSTGTGKTLFGLQFLYYGAKQFNEPGIFISFEEDRDSLIRHSSAFGWNFEELEKKNLLKVLLYKPHQVEKLMQSGGGPIKDAIKAMGAKRLVIDSITSYGLLFKDDYQKRETILDLFDMLQKWGCTSLVISELPPKVAEVKEGSVGFLTDAIISLYYTEEEKGVRVHSCEILKMRGTRHTNKRLAIEFENEGLVIYPEIEVF